MTARDVHQGDAVQPGDPVVVDRYTAAPASITGSRRSSLVLLAHVRPRAVPSEPVLPHRPVRRRDNDARDPSLDRRGAVLRLLRAVPALLASELWEHTDNVWLGKHPRRAQPAHEENLPEVGKYNAGQKMVFWSMSLLILVLITSGVVIWDQYFVAVHQRRAEAHRGAGALRSQRSWRSASGSSMSMRRSGCAARSAP